MSTTLVMPKLGLTMEEGLVQEWVAQPGASFRAGDVLLVVETDKIANEVEAVADGTMQEILVPAGETVACGTPIAKWVSAGDAVDDAANAATAAATTGTTTGTTTTTATATATTTTTATATATDAVADTHAAPTESSTSTPVLANGGRIVATPFARKLAKQLGVDLATVTGSGPRGRIKGPDVQKAAANGSATSTVVAKAPAPAPALPSVPVVGGSRRAATRFESVTAERMTAAKQVPHFYLSTEVEVSALNDLRRQLNELPNMPRVSVTHLLLAGLARTLADHPEANCVWDNGEVVQHATIDIGLAVSTDSGLMAPVIRDVGGDRLHTIADKCRAVVERTRTGKLSPDDLGGGATSISNAGMHDVTYMGSIITPGQSSIFGIGSVRDVFRPDEDGRPALRREMGIVMSCDHRIFDGVGGLKVLNSWKNYLENPLQIVV